MNPSVFPPQVVGLELIIGASIGAVIGLFVDIVLTRGKRGVMIDALLGAFGFAGGAIATFLVRIKPTTQEFRSDGAVIRTTVHHYQYPYRIAFVLAVVLPLIFEMLRTWWLKGRPQNPA
jgi:hypothetical protein